MDSHGVTALSAGLSCLRNLRYLGLRYDTGLSIAFDSDKLEAFEQ